jgi:hypothetical protein
MLHFGIRNAVPDLVRVAMRGRLRGALDRVFIADAFTDSCPDFL